MTIETAIPPSVYQMAIPSILEGDVGKALAALGANEAPPIVQDIMQRIIEGKRR